MDEGVYGFGSALMSPEDLMLPLDCYQPLLSSSSGFPEPASIAPQLQKVAGGDEEEDTFSVIKAKIASHPLYPRLLDAYIDCQKVGAPPEVASFLEDVCRKKELRLRDCASSSLNADLEFDKFMEIYCNTLVKFKSDLTKLFNEATMFLNEIEMQLSNLCKGLSMGNFSDEVGAGLSDDDINGEIEEQMEGQPRNSEPGLKAKLLHKFGSHITSLKLEFSKKKKKGKLPREARQALLDWWSLHYKWPYPTEADKAALAESTGLDQKQINNWFINQRKRHWKPSENLQFGWEDLSGPFMDD